MPRRASCTERADQVLRRFRDFDVDCASPDGTGRDRAGDCSAAGDKGACFEIPLWVERYHEAMSDKYPFRYSNGQAGQPLRAVQLRFRLGRCVPIKVIEAARETRESEEFH